MSSRCGHGTTGNAAGSEKTHIQGWVTAQEAIVLMTDRFHSLIHSFTQ